MWTTLPTSPMWSLSWRRQKFSVKPCQKNRCCFTFRSAKEGGEQAISTEAYIALNRAAIDSGLVDTIDLELFTGDDQVKETVAYAHAHDVKVVMSNDDFHKTPEAEEIIARLRKMQSFDADIPKIALMPQSTSDVLTLLTATLEMQEQYADRPIITMSMAKTGVISRLAGEVFGSAATFGAVKKSLCTRANLGK